MGMVVLHKHSHFQLLKVIQISLGCVIWYRSKNIVLTCQNESHTNLKSLGLALKTNPTKKSKKKWPPISCQGERVRTNIAQDLDGAETPLANNWHCLQQKIKANQSVCLFLCEKCIIWKCLLFPQDFYFNSTKKNTLGKTVECIIFFVKLHIWKIACIF